ncbi:carboxylesterase family protein [Paracoccus aurantiacus]|uniref:Carboxylic ester hydrolase n=1 Tax=Paracoccus aurantiacus TaxID=2599412 RepID=A0A5C6S2F5_9RHOB|nr:carboxylesterase family protein [Paracoccus aurantiacus]
MVIASPAGQILARRDCDIIRATGIPYADAGRWELPKPSKPAPVRASALSPACPQLPIPRLDAVLPDAFAGIAFAERCQCLSVSAPADARDLPVMVWLHGGSYESGAADMGVLDPSALVREQQVVFVAISYRLGLFGWLGFDGHPANLGALDVIEALRWIAENIAAFGGDPGRVTLFGQSSGGDLTARLMMAGAARGMFHRAIIQSAPLDLPLKTARMRRVMRRVASGALSDEKVSEILSRQARLRKAVRRFGLAGQMPFGPEFGHAPFPIEPQLATAHAEIAPHIPILIGHMRDEAALFLPPFAQGAASVLDAPRRLAVRALTARLYGRPARRFASRHHAAGGYAARFVIDCGGGDWGSAHLADLPLLFPSDDWLGTPLVPREMSAEDLRRIGRPIRRIWADFARDGTVAAPPAEATGLIRLHLP